MNGNINDLLNREISKVEEESLVSGVYYGVVTKVEALLDDRIKVTFKLTLEDESHHYVYLKTDLKPKIHWYRIVCEYNH